MAKKTPLSAQERYATAKAELEALLPEYRKMEKRIHELGTARRDAFSEIACAEFDAADDKMAVIFKPEYGDVSVEFLRKTEKFLWDRYETATRGINYITHQRTVQLLFSPSRAAKMRAIIEDTLPYIIPMNADMRDYNNKAPHEHTHGFCLYDILEHGHSEYASYNVLISKDKRIKVMATRYSNVTCTPEMDFDEGLDYLLKKHYYERDKESDSSYDD